jgi:hypothetical protein
MIDRRVPAGAATNDFRSLKEHVFWAGCFQGEALEHLRVEAQGEVAVRASADSGGQVDLNIYNFWRYPGLEWGHYLGPNRSTAFVEQARPMPPAQHRICLRLACGRYIADSRSVLEKSLPLNNNG